MKKCLTRAWCWERPEAGGECGQQSQGHYDMERADDVEENNRLFQLMVEQKWVMLAQMVASETQVN